MSTSIAQVARLLTEIPYIEAHPGITLAEVARVFAVPPAQVRKDVLVAIYCGLPGGYPGDLIDVDLDLMDDEGALYLTNPTTLDRPLRLTVAEAASLHLALLAVRSLVDGGTAATIDGIILKIADPAASSVELRLSAGDEAVRRVVGRAIVDAERLELVYDGASRGVTTRPRVDPAALFVRQGAAYLTAFSVDRGDWRTYRLDRVVAARPTGESAGAHGAPPDPEGWAKSLAGSVTARLTLTDEARWVAEYYPTSSQVTRADGLTEVELPVISPAWLVRLLLSLGDTVRAVEPPAYAEAARDRARQALAAYEALGLARGNAG
ncbi:MAG: WYL domain-containing protein [Propionibacteriaceae bacterium]|jgi:proteasome accessory factor C|nr:WYL domain-containing protein [Propionibacteriaceae bacterium]